MERLLAISAALVAASSGPYEIQPWESGDDHFGGEDRSAQLNSQIAHNIPLAVARCLGDVDAQRCRLAPSLNINPVA